MTFGVGSETAVVGDHVDVDETGSDSSLLHPPKSHQGLPEGHMAVGAKYEAFPREWRWLLLVVS